MKNSSILAPAVLAALFVAAPASALPAAAVYTLSDAIVTQKLTVSGCAALTTGGLATATFYADNTYSIVRNFSELPPQSGTWASIPASSSYTVYMSPDDASLSSMFSAIDVLVLANCQLKYPAATVSVIAPSVQASKNSMIVKTSTKSATLTYAMKGLQQNTFKGPSKFSKFGATITLKGNVVEAPSFTL